MTELRPLDESVCARAEILNLGAANGRWLLAEARRLGLERTVGVDRNRRTVALAQAAGLPVYEADFTRLDPRAFPAVKVVVFDNVLEHLSSLEQVGEVVDIACAIASHVVYIRHPSFEHEEYLASLGLKQYWTDWPEAHPSHVRLHDFVAMAARNGVYNLIVRPLKRAPDSDDPTILPASAPPNQRKTAQGPGSFGAYDEALHGAKPHIAFDRPVYFAFDVFLFLHPDAPSVRYRGDTETGVARPYLIWSESSSPRPRVQRSFRRSKPS